MRSALFTALPRLLASVLTSLSSVAFVSSASSIAFVTSVLVSPAPVQAQTSDQVGIRALGMSGAFTAVANDATATWWNPAGLASGAYFNAILEYAHPDDRPGDGLRGVSVAFR